MTLDIKICGLKTDAAMAAALAGGASHVGFIFFPKSPRYVEPAEAGRLRVAARGKALADQLLDDASSEQQAAGDGKVAEDRAEESPSAP